MGILASIRKSMKLRSISKRLAADSERELTMADIANNSPFAKNRALAEKELFDMVENDPLLAAIMRHKGTTRTDLSNAYEDLLAAGCGQWVRGHWVAASALAFGTTLGFVLTSTKTGSISLDAMGRLLDYFQRGETGPID